MAFSAATRFVVRTDGSDTANGGDFVVGATGTDYSNQAAPQYSLTGGTSAGAGSVILHASAAADMVGNGLVVTAGTNATTGYYQVVSVSVGVSITVDRAVTTGVGAAIAFAIGGAFLTIAKAHGLAIASNSIAIKTGTYTVTTALTVTLDSTAAPGIPLSFVGFNATPGDNGAQATWTTSTNSINIVEFTQAKNVLFQNLILSSTAGTRGKGLYAKTTGNSSIITAVNCKLSGFSVGVEGNFAVDWAFTSFFLINSRITGCTSHGLRNTGSTVISFSMLDANAGDGAIYSAGALFSGSWNCAHSIFYNNTGNGLNLSNFVGPGTSLGQMSIRSCDFSTNGAAGLLLSNNAQNVSITNSIFDVNGTYGIDGSAGTTTIAAQFYSNAFYNNVTAATRNIGTGMGTVTLSANPYNAIGTDFTLNSVAGGGQALKGTGFPGLLQFGGTGNADVGALQTTGGATGSGLLVFSGMGGGMNG